MQEFDDLGEDVVLQRLAAHIWSEEDERLAREWLDKRAAVLGRLHEPLDLELGEVLVIAAHFPVAAAEERDCPYF
jgi:hypothetical protein